MKRCLCLAIVGALILGCGAKIYSQNVGINSDGSAPNANAMLDVVSPATGNGKGMLIPRMTEAQRSTASAALAGGLLDDSGNLRGGACQGLLVYQTDVTQGFYYNTSATSTPSWILLIFGISDSAGKKNTAIGYQALNLNTTGYNNTASGCQSLSANLEGFNNTAYGYRALANNISSENTAVGVEALLGTNGASSFKNTALGFQAGGNNSTGFNNTFIGYSANASSGGLWNATAIGNYALAPASNTITLGNDQIATLYCNTTTITALSDASVKENIYNADLGLDFISRLRPVYFNYIFELEKTQRLGLIAQEVQSALDGKTFPSLSKMPDGKLALGYTDFVMPLINAVKELKAENDELKTELKAIKEKLGM